MKLSELLHRTHVKKYVVRWTDGHRVVRREAVPEQVLDAVKAALSNLPDEIMINASSFALEGRSDLFITDLGMSHDAEHVRADGTKEKIHVPRYGVWGPRQGKPQVIDSGDDLEKLREKHGITSEVIKLGKK